MNLFPSIALLMMLMTTVLVTSSAIAIDPNSAGISMAADSLLPEPEIVYTNGTELTLYGKGHVEEHYGRLPLKYKGVVRPPVWSLGQHSTGMQLRFTTNSPEIHVKWVLLRNSDKSNMTKIGSSGVDLYCKVNGVWQYVNSGIPKDLKNESKLITDMDTEVKEFLIHLPLYDGIRSIEVGIHKDYKLNAIDPNEDRSLPIVIYGTSITQGASASRAGMAYPAILSRNLGIETINLGFSGNGRFESTVGEFLCEINSQLLVLDCTPNSSTQVIESNTLNLIKQYRACHPNTPILMVESIIREYSHFRTQNPEKFGTAEFIANQNRALATAFKQAKEQGISDIYYLAATGLIGDDHDGTIDGTHLNDLGMWRIANAIGDKIKTIIK